MYGPGRELMPERFAYYGAKLMAQVSQNLLLAALFVLAATGDNSAIGLSGVFIATLIPAAFLGLPGGALVDSLGAGRGYVLGVVLRFLAVLLGFAILDHTTHAWIVAAAYSAGSQIFTPAELAMIPALGVDKINRAHSLLSALQFTGQGIGMLLLAPALFFIGGPGLMFGVAAGGFLVVTAAGCWLAFRLRGTAADVRVPRRQAFSPGETITFFRNEPRAGYAVGLLGFKAMATKAIFVAFPIYLHRNLGDDTLALAALAVPGAIGLGLGLLLAGRLFDRRHARTLMRSAFVGIALGALALGALDFGVETFVRFGHYRQITFIEPTINTTLAVAAPVAFVLGFSMSLALIAGRTVLTATAPIGQQARVFAAQLWMTDTILIFPLLLAGIGTEVAGARPMLIGLGIVGLAGMLLLEWTLPRKRQPLLPLPVEPSGASQSAAPFASR